MGILEVSGIVGDFAFGHFCHFTFGIWHFAFCHLAFRGRGMMIGPVKLVLCRVKAVGVGKGPRLGVGKGPGLASTGKAGGSTHQGPGRPNG